MAFDVAVVDQEENRDTMTEIEPEIIEPDDPQLREALVATPNPEERLALIKARSRLAIVRTVVGGLGVVAFFGFLSTCVYVTCGGAG